MSPRTRLLTLSLGAALLVGSALSACQVPVFRYALERWNADRYTVIVLSDGPLEVDAVASWKKIKELAQQPTSGFDVRQVDVSKQPSAAELEIWKRYSGVSQGNPLMAVLYPDRAQVATRIAHCAPFSAGNVSSVTASPARTKLVSELIGGDSATWIFLRSGNKTKDDAALAVLKEHLPKEEKRIELPSAEELEVSAAVIENSRIKLRIGFSVVEVSRDDSGEQFLVDALLNSEGDLRDYDEPMAFPVFGRGRVLYALVGKGINAETISSAHTFITGPCSCQVKNQNPGFDLLTGWDWGKSVGENLISSPAPETTDAPKLLQIPPGKK